MIGAWRYGASYKLWKGWASKRQCLPLRVPCRALRRCQSGPQRQCTTPAKGLCLSATSASQERSLAIICATGGSRPLPTNKARGRSAATPHRPASRRSVPATAASGPVWLRRIRCAGRRPAWQPMPAHRRSYPGGPPALCVLAAPDAVLRQFVDLLRRALARTRQQHREVAVGAIDDALHQLRKARVERALGVVGVGSAKSL